jgi:hypothetical protein
MAKPLGERTKLIRQAITDHPRTGNTDLARLLNEQHAGLDVKPNDIAKQKQAMKKLGDGASRTKRAPRGRKKTEPRAQQPVTTAAAVHKAPVSGGLTADELTTLKGLASKVGGVDTLIGYLEVVRDIR